MSTKFPQILLLKNIRSQKPVYSWKQGTAHSKYFSIFRSPNNIQVGSITSYPYKVKCSSTKVEEKVISSEEKKKKKNEKRAEQASSFEGRVKRRQQWGLGLPDEPAGTSPNQERSRALLEPQQPALALQEYSTPPSLLAPALNLAC